MSGAAVVNERDYRAESHIGTRVIMQTWEPESGMALYVAELVAALARSGLRVTLFCPENFKYGQMVQDAGAEVVRAAHRDILPASLLRRLKRNFSFVSRSVRTQLRLVQPGDIVHFQSMLHLPLGFVFIFAGAFRRARLVLTAHDPVPHRWRFAKGLQGAERLMLRFAYKLFDQIIVHNETGRKLLVEKFNVDKERVSVVPHGLYATESVSNYPEFDCLRLLIFGGIRENKGLHLAIEAFQSAVAAGLPVRLTIAGAPQTAGEDRYWQRCKQMIATQPHHIEVINKIIPDEEIAELFQRHHAVLLPYTEFFSESGVATLALCHQRPIVASTAGGLGELIEAGECGIRIALPTMQSVARAIAEASKAGPARLRQMGINGARYLRRNRSWEIAARETSVIYQRLHSPLAGTND
jgi:glycosyltransferase involved in cell wall biosynthesis